jgi:molybdenum cofactor synthesis domain-containing protein
MIALLEAQRIVAALPLPTPTIEEVALEQSLGRVVASAPASDRDLPPFDRVTMDGFALRAADVASGGSLTVVAAVAAGTTAPRPLRPGEAMRVMTGAPLPEGADSVVPVEESVDEPRGSVRFTRSPKPGQNLHRRGVDLKRGDRPVEPGERVTAARVALLATLGARRVTTFRAPRVALLATGDELVEPDVVPTGAQIRESNRFALAAQVASAACVADVRPIVRDEPSAIAAAVEAALGGSSASDARRGADVVLMTGGSSVGDFDFSKSVATKLGAKLWFEQVSIKPGKPVLLFTLRDRVLFCLPGNPVSSFVTFELLVRPLLERLSGARAAWPIAQSLPLTTALAAPSERDLLQVATLRADAASGALAVEPIRWSGSGDVVSIARTNALVHVPRGVRFEAGAIARTFVLGSAFDGASRASEPVA